MSERIGNRNHLLSIWLLNFIKYLVENGDLCLIDYLYRRTEFFSPTWEQTVDSRTCRQVKWPNKKRGETWINFIAEMVLSKLPTCFKTRKTQSLTFDSFPPQGCVMCTCRRVVLPISWVHNFITTLLSMDVDLSVYNPIQKRTRCIKWIFQFSKRKLLHTHTKEDWTTCRNRVCDALRIIASCHFFWAMTRRSFEINWAKRRRRRTRKKEKRQNLGMSLPFRFRQCATIAKWMNQ